MYYLTTLCISNYSIFRAYKWAKNMCIVWFVRRLFYIVFIVFFFLFRLILNALSFTYLNDRPQKCWEKRRICSLNQKIFSHSSRETRRKQEMRCSFKKLFRLSMILSKQRVHMSFYQVNLKKTKQSIYTFIQKDSLLCIFYLFLCNLKLKFSFIFFHFYAKR